MTTIPVYSFEDAFNKSSLDASSKLILYILNSHARNNTKHCFLTVKTIASEASLSKRCVFMKFKTLEEAGFLVRKQQYKDNEQQCNIYVLRVPHPFVHGFSEMTLQLSNGEPDSLGGCNRFTGGVNTLHTELINSNLLNLTHIEKPQKKKNAQEGKKKHAIWDEEKVPQAWIDKLHEKTGRTGLECYAQEMFEQFKAHYINNPKNRPDVNPLLTWSATWIAGRIKNNQIPYSPKQSLKKEEISSTPRNSTDIDREAIINTIKADKAIETEYLTLWPNGKPVYFRKIREFVSNTSNPRPEDFISYLTAKG